MRGDCWGTLLILLGFMDLGWPRVCRRSTSVLFRYGKALCSAKLGHLYVYSGMARPYTLPSWDTSMLIQVWQCLMLCQAETLVCLFRYGKALCSAKLRHLYVYSGMVRPYALPSWDTCMFIQVWQGLTLCQVDILVCLFRYGKALCSAKLRHLYVYSGMVRPYALPSWDTCMFIQVWQGLTLCQVETLVWQGLTLCQLRHLYINSGMAMPYALSSWDTCMFIQVWQCLMLCQAETLVCLFRYGKALCSVKLIHLYVYSGMARPYALSSWDTCMFIQVWQGLMLCQADTLVCLFRYGNVMVPW